MADVQRVELGGPLAGEWIEIDRDEISVGILEDFESFRRVSLVLDAMEVVIVGSSLVKDDLVVPDGMKPIRAALRRMKPPQMQAIVAGFATLGDVPNGS